VKTNRVKTLKPETISLSFAGVGILLWFLWPILDSAYVADDIPNSQRSAHLAFYSENWLQFVIRGTRQWMQSEGRFFPVATLENVLLFHTIHSRFIYKSLQLIFILFLILTLSYLVRLLTNCWRASLLVLIFFAASLQVRVWYDPTISFGLLLPSVGIKAICALILILLGIRSEKKWYRRSYFFVASISWSLALMQYEVVLLIAPLAVLIAYHETQYTKRVRLAAVVAIALPSVTYTIFSFVIRSGVRPSTAYTTNFDPSAFLPTLKYQVLGAIPLTVPYSRVDNRLRISDTIAHLSVLNIIFCLVALVGIAHLILGLGVFSRKTRATVFLFGVILIVMPAVPTSLSVRWQAEVGPGHAYLPVMLQYLGTTILLLVATIETKNLIKLLIRKNKTVLKSLTVCFATVLSVGSIAIICVNRSGIEFTNSTFRGFQSDREIFEATVRRGLVDNSLRDGVFLYSKYDPNLWINMEYVKWLGGPTIANFGSPATMIACRELGDEKCLKKNGGIFILEYSSTGSAVAVITVLRDWSKAPTSKEDIESTLAIARNRSDLMCGRSKAQMRNGWWVSKCDVGEVGVLQKIQQQYGV